MKEPYSTITLSLLLIILGLIFGYSLHTPYITEEDFGCYIFHVQECLDAHSKNMTLGLCSGFYFEPREEDKEIFCAIHPEEDCFTNVPRECLLK